MLLAAAVHVDTQLTYQGQCRWLLRRLRQTLWLSTREINGQSQKRIVGGWEEKGNNKKNSLRALKGEFEKKKKKSGPTFIFFFPFNPSAGRPNPK